MVAVFLYLDAGIGMGVMMLMRNRFSKGANEERLTHADFPYVVAMVALDIVAPILMMYGLRINSAANTALLNNFEIVATIVMAVGCWLAGR